MNGIAFVCNGEMRHSEQMKHRIQSFSRIIAIDGGAAHCHHLKLKPDFLIGDFDSIPPEVRANFAHVPHKQFPQDKDKTDLELALEEFLSDEVEGITIFAALGGRCDHTLFNLLLLSRYPARLFIETESERLFVIDKKTTLSCQVGQTISLLPLNGPVHGITTQGLKWELSNATLDKNFIGISNIALDPHPQIQVASGDLLCYLFRK